MAICLFADMWNTSTSLSLLNEPRSIATRDPIPQESCVRDYWVTWPAARGAGCSSHVANVYKVEQLASPLRYIWLWRTFLNVRAGLTPDGNNFIPNVSITMVIERVMWSFPGMCHLPLEHIIIVWFQNNQLWIAQWKIFDLKGGLEKRDGIIKHTRGMIWKVPL